MKYSIFSFKGYHIITRLSLFLIFLFSSCNTGSDAIKPPDKIIARGCATMQNYQDRIQNDPTFARGESELERTIDRYLRTRNAGEKANFRSGIVIIPVVVHVVYNNTTENISAAQIQSQIDILNEDFRKLNSDVSSVPSDFTSDVVDARIEFKLAERDPSCAPTDGITRTSTTVTSFSYTSSAGTGPARNPVKFSSTNGADGWPPEDYLNIWVCDLSGGLLGYASFPSELSTRPAEDGVVVDYAYFGNIGTATAPFDLGRTTTHEIGHWLNLRHIWGDDVTACTGSDFVDDTPNQGGAYTGCPSHPSSSCGSNDMFMNFMDYVDDNCMVMFTNGQSDRMDAVLYTTRSGIVSSQGDVPPLTVSQDLWSRDMADDLGDEPNTTSSHMYRSDDIWVRNTNNGFVNQEHQNPIGGATNYVYVRVRNRGCGAATSGNVNLYWAKAGSGLSWPFPWTGTPPPIMGNPIGVQNTGSVAASDFVILEFSWVAPLPSDYASFGADRAHFCLLSRIETSSSSPFGMTFPETTSLGSNVRNNNNIVWKNVTIAEPSGGRYNASVTVSNFAREANKYRLIFNSPKQDLPAFDLGRIKVKLGEKLFEIWKSGGMAGQGFEPLDGTEIQLLRSGAYLDNIALDPRQVTVVDVNFEPNRQKLRYKRNLIRLEMEQRNKNGNEFVGAQLFEFKVEK